MGGWGGESFCVQKLQCMHFSQTPPTSTLNPAPSYMFSGFSSGRMKNPVLGGDESSCS